MESPSPSCLNPAYPAPQYPHSAAAKYFGDGSTPESECYLRKLDFAYIRAYRKVYWAQVVIQAVFALPPDVRERAWEIDYSPDIPVQHRTSFTGTGSNVFSMRTYLTRYDLGRAGRSLYVVQALFYLFYKGLLGFKADGGSDGGKCSFGTGYVAHTHGSWVYICWKHFKDSTTERLSDTIVHEFLHHVWGVDDQPYAPDPKNKAYGREAARVLAEHSKLLAINNIDNYGSWISGISGMWQVQLNRCGNLKTLSKDGKTYVFNKQKLKYDVQ